MTDPFALLYAIAAPFLLGVPASRLLGLSFRGDRIGFPAWSWMLGCGLLGVLLNLCRESNLSPDWWWLVVLVAIASLELSHRRRSLAAPAPASAQGRGFCLFVVAGVVFCLWFALAGMDRPCIEGDEGNIWSLKAKSLLVDWGPGFGAAQVHNLHPDYPQLAPWLQVWVYVLTGTANLAQFENRWLVQLCDVALFVALASALRHRLHPLLAAALAALVLFEPEFQSLCRTAYADGMVALGLVVALDGFLRWRDGGGRAHAWLACAGLAFALWSKNEATLYLACAGLAALLARTWCTPLRGGWSLRNLLLLGPAVAVVANTTAFNRRFGMQSDLFGANPTGKSMFELMAEQWPERVPALLSEAGHATLTLGHTHVVFGLAVLGAVLLPHVAFGARFALPTLALFGSFLGLHLVYVGSFLPLRFHLDTSYMRVLFHLVPATMVLLAAWWRTVAAELRSGDHADAP